MPAAPRRAAHEQHQRQRRRQRQVVRARRGAPRDRAVRAAGAGDAGRRVAPAAVLLAAAGIGVSAWHGAACTELATLAGAARAGTALGTANTTVHAGFFLTPPAIPARLARGSWGEVRPASAAGALLAYPSVLSAPAARARGGAAATRGARSTIGNRSATFIRVTRRRAILSPRADTAPQENLR
ncbi:hypothetical protein GIY62_09270 [Burkholderia plantarii]|uniref:hypothetical protein n=1 Tax=Burkholderia plantarii TaxID=41899 RepID=UPI00272D688C|nr:hypothetical protein [Burkholderia plantarii]WLE60809.1 hypothetical protein GIY62_09270 [Burkholderia plantarii]